MEIRVVAGDITGLTADAAVVNLFEGVREPGGATGAMDRALEGGIRRLIAAGEVRGKLGELTVVHTLGHIPPERVVIAGLGKAEEFDLDRVRQVAAEVCRLLRRLGVRHGATIVHGAGLAGLDARPAARALAEGSLLGLYRFRRHQARGEEDTDLERLTVVEFDRAKLPGIESGLDQGRIGAEFTCLARDLINEPGNLLTPGDLAERATQVAEESDLEIEVLQRDELERRGMGALLGVAQGSHQPPCLIVLRYRGAPGSAQPTLGLLGKGVTFDAGGISIKPAAGMGAMKGDMAGGAAVIGALGALGKLQPAVNVTGIVPAVENLPGGGAYRPGDVLRAMNGKSIEIITTDAEGRLILADALCYAKQLGLSPLVDVATLTGNCRQALGSVYSGIFGNDQGLVERVIRAGQEAGERYWQLPLHPDYKELIRGDYGDIKNSGGGAAGAITAAWFLAEFAQGTPWAHLDIAGTSTSDRDRGPLVKGATGVALRTLVNLALEMAEG